MTAKHRCFARAIKTFRTIASASIRELADATGLHYHTISRAENGVASYNVLCAIAKALWLTPAELKLYSISLFGNNVPTDAVWYKVISYQRTLAKKGLYYGSNNNRVQGTDKTRASGASISSVFAARSESDAMPLPE